MNLFDSLLQELSSILKKLNWQLTTAESCTGGLIASSITNLAGSSTWFERGFITYSNLSKQEMLGVPEQLIQQFGAVSDEVACAMVHGALKHSVAHMALAVTGIAGPTGGSVEKPVGTVCFAWGVRDHSPQFLKQHFDGTRQEIRLAATQEALRGALNVIKKLDLR